MELLELENLTLKRAPLRRFRSHAEGEALVDDLSLMLPSGASIGIVGEDRGGLLALTFAILKLGRVAAGRIVFGGIDLTSLSERRFRPVRRRLQAVFPDHFGQLTPNLTIDATFREVLAVWHGRESRSQWRLRIEDVMIACGLPEAVRHLYPFELDLVERQQVVLARVLLTGPELLICHGVTEGLDAVQQGELLNLVKRLRGEFGFALAVMTDDLAVACHLGDDIAVIHRGQLVESGTAEALVHRPQHDFTRRLVKCTA